jgi:hypothetical protein
VHLEFGSIANPAILHPSPVKRMADSTADAQSVWHALDAWAKTLKPWQRQILAYATRGRSLTENQISEIYELFLEDSKIDEPKQRAEIAIDVTGRPSFETVKPLQLDRICDLRGLMLFLKERR